MEPKQPEWTKQLDAREWSQVLHAQAYVQNHLGAGAPGHGQFVLIAKLAKLLDGFEQLTSSQTDQLMELSQQKDDAYTERDQCLVLIALMAQRLGLNVGMGLHVDKPGEEWEADWRNILFIDLPAGQVSWHIHESEACWFYFVGAYDGTWDGHTTSEKYRRVLEPGL